MVPGQANITFPEGTAKLLPKGAILVFQIHYTTNGNLPTPADPVVVSGSSVNIQVSTTLRARAFKIATPPSEARSALYLIGVQPGGDGPVITITYPTVGIRQL